MKPARTYALLLQALLAGLLLAACGNKGDLVRPEPAPAAMAPGASAGLDAGGGTRAT